MSMSQFLSKADAKAYANVALSEENDRLIDEIARLTRERDEYARQRNAQTEHDADEIEKLERERDAARAEATRLNNCHRIIAKQVGFYKPELPHFTKIEIYLGVLRAAAQCAAGPLPWELLDNGVDEQNEPKEPRPALRPCAPGADPKAPRAD